MHSLTTGLYKLLVHQKVDYINFCSFLLILILFGNLNGIFNYAFQIVAPLSPIILVLSAVIIISLVYQNYEGESILFWFFVLFYILYLYFATLSYILYEEHIYSGNKYLLTLRGYLSSIIILLCFYKLTTWSLYHIQFYSFLNRLYIFTLLGVGIIFISSFTGFNLGLDTERAGGLFANPNNASRLILYCTCLTLCFTVSERKKYGSLYLILIPILFYAVFVTFSKAGLITFPLLILFFLGFCLVRYKKLYRPKRKIFVCLFFAFIFSVVGISIYFTSIVEQLSWGQVLRLQRTLAFLSGEISEATTSERSTLFRIGFELIAEHPLIGNGLTSFHAYDIPVNGKHIGVHNTFFLILGESGIIPFILYIVLMLIVLVKAWKLKNLAMSFLFLSILLVYILNVAGTGHTALDDRVSNCLFGMMLGYFAYVDKLKKQSNQSKLST